MVVHKRNSQFELKTLKVSEDTKQAIRDVVITFSRDFRPLLKTRPEPHMNKQKRFREMFRF